MVIAPPIKCNMRALAQFMCLHQGNINRVQKFKNLGAWLTASGREKLNLRNTTSLFAMQHCEESDMSCDYQC